MHNSNIVRVRVQPTVYAAHALEEYFQRRSMVVGPRKGLHLVLKLVIVVSTFTEIVNHEGI